MRSGTSTFELPNYVTFARNWVLVGLHYGLQKCISFLPISFHINSAFCTSQTGIILKFPPPKKKAHYAIMHKADSDKIYTSVFKVCSFYLERLFVCFRFNKIQG